MEQAMEQLAMMRGGVPMSQRDNLPSKYDSGDEKDEDYYLENLNDEGHRDHVREKSLEKRHAE